MASSRTGITAAQRPPHVLVVDDDEGMRENMALVLEHDGFDVDTAADGAAALARLERSSFDLVLLDIQMPRMSGLEVLAKARERFPDVEFMMVTVLKEIPTVVEAMKLGAFDFITKDYRPGELQLKARQAVEHRRTARKVAYLQDEVARQTPGDMVIGKSAAMIDLAELISKVAPLPATVLILGESGTGKELLAREVHRRWCAANGREGAPFVTVNLAAIPTELAESTLFGHEKGAFTGAGRQHLGKFELADGGTLFLDEIGELRPDLQAKLLRAIQEREVERVGGHRPVPVDVRLVAATNVDLEAAVRTGAFREDLYYRINVIPVRVPPLRERACDVDVLAKHFLEKHALRFRRPVPGLTPAALEVLRAYPWPGNVRELENVAERLVAVTAAAQIDDVELPVELSYPRFFEQAQSKADGLQVAIDAFERSFIRLALARTGWNRRAAAERLGIGYSTLKKKLRRHELTPEGEDEGENP